MKYAEVREEELKNKVAQDYFEGFDTTKIIGNIDFCVTLPAPKNQLETFEIQSLLWAEAKKGRADGHTSLVQLILTIGKARTFDKQLPPAFLGAFDAEKIAFIPYNSVQEIFYQNDFNWNVAPSNYETKEFKQVFETVKATLEAERLLFFFEKDEAELKAFIQTNFVEGKIGIAKVKIDKNNFLNVYNRWLESVKPTIGVNWELTQKVGIIDGDFYLADLLSKENKTLREKLYVILNEDHYELDRKLNEIGLFTSSRTSFTDKQKAHQTFWNKYERPPKEEYWDYIIKRRDLLVPQDVRERKGSFFTPKIWVELSQKYLADTLGEDWQDEYYVWDCAAGTGNLLAGLTNKYNIWASTLDKQDVDVMHDRIENGANLLKSHVFQFDFLNDDFSTLPQELQKIINDPEKRKKLVIYINPPYAEATTARTVTRTGENKAGVVKGTKMREKYRAKIKNAANEIFAVFMARVYDEIPGAKLGMFSKMKFIQGSNFSKFKDFFLAGFQKGFVVRANTFDNVKGHFPIGFTLWDLEQEEQLNKVSCDVISNEGKKVGKKKFYGKLPQSINKWLKSFDHKNGIPNIGYMGNPSPDFQHNSQLYIAMDKGIEHFNFYAFIPRNIIHGVVYFAVRHAIRATWLNDRDQFLFPKKKWEEDTEFQNDCLAFTLFHGQNRISTEAGTNHWIPFKEQEVNAQEKFESNFMTKFIAGKVKLEGNGNLLEAQKIRTTPLTFSPEAKAVFEAGKALWVYYHQQPNVNVNASLYDIRAHFQGRNARGRMNSKSDDQTYTELIGNLRDALKVLAEKIEPKVYAYGFLKS